MLNRIAMKDLFVANIKCKGFKMIRIDEVKYTMELLNDGLPIKQVRFVLESCRVVKEDITYLIKLSQRIIKRNQCSEKFSTISK